MTKMHNTLLALFPLQILLLPGEKTRLHIFEDRYRQLLLDCENTNILFGIPFTINGNLTGYGCAAKLTEVVERYDNGSSDIEVEAINIFKIDQYYPRLGEKLYPGGDVVMMDNEKLPVVSEVVMQTLEGYMRKANISLIPELLSTRLSPFDIATIIQLPELEKLKLIQAKSPEMRERIILNNLRLLDKLQDQTPSIEGKFFLN